MLKITICWTGYSGYLVACWRELCAIPELTVSIHASNTLYQYDPALLNGLPIRIYSEEELLHSGRLSEAIAVEKPDIVVFSGYSYRPFRRLLDMPELKDTKFIMCMDAAWRGHWRQILARFAWRKYIRRTAGVIVAGERGRQYARYLGFPASRIFSSTYGFDFDSFRNVRPADASGRRPQSFAFIGRYAPVKGVDTLLAAYAEYRRLRPDAWPLHCYGKGQLGDRLSQAEGVVDHGFLQPSELADALAQNGVMVLPSLHEPWGVALAEAAASGMPVICSDACCSGLDIIRHLYNGMVFAAGDVKMLTGCMLFMHDNPALLPEMGQRAQIYAEAYSARNWANRWLWNFKTVVSE